MGPNSSVDRMFRYGSAEAQGHGTGGSWSGRRSSPGKRFNGHDVENSEREEGEETMEIEED